MGLPRPSCPACIRNILSIPASRASQQCFQRSSAKNLGCSLLIAWYLDPELHMAISGTFFKPCGSRVASRFRAHVPSTADTTNTLRPMFSQILTLFRASGMTGKRIHIPDLHEPDPDLVLFAHRQAIVPHQVIAWRGLHHGLYPTLPLPSGGMRRHQSFDNGSAFC